MPDHLKEELCRLEDSLNSREDQSGSYGQEITENAWKILKNSDLEYGQGRMEDLVHRYSQTFPEFYEEDPVGNPLDYLDRFDDIEDAIESLEY